MSRAATLVLLAAASCGRLGFSSTGDAGGAAADGASGDGSVDGGLPFNIVFVTSTTHAGDLGGLAGADAICQGLAAAAGLGGTYVAWLSTSTVSANSRLGSARGWTRPDGRPVFDQQQDIAQGHLLYPPRLDETGADVGQQTITTATRNGLLSATGTTCGDWTLADMQFVDVGDSSAATQAFAFTGNVARCATLRRFYCFGIDRSNPIVVSAQAGRKAFVSQGGLDGTNGPAAADAMCASEALAAGRTGSFKALMATTTATAASRFSTALGPWSRFDGVLLSDTAAELFTAPYWHTALSVDAQGGGFYASSGVWTGAATPTALGTNASTCNNWSTPSSAATGLTGATDDSKTSRSFAFGNGQCSQTYRAYCLEE
ncbi:MAG: Flagellar hook-length control protein FliK [Myxococcales bacterium]|nr:Flagellar hook-length control protein FliK [Myxococcales bacterium]